MGAVFLFHPLVEMSLDLLFDLQHWQQEVAVFIQEVSFEKQHEGRWRAHDGLLGEEARLGLVQYTSLNI